MRTGTRQGPEIWIRGPVAAPPAPEPAPAPTGTVRRFSWVGTHGGSGVSTLATVYGGQDCGRDWPGAADPPSVLLVARTHATGLACVVHALEVFRRGEAPPGLDLDAVVLVADAPGRLPRPLAQQVRLIESVIDVYRVPWVSAWRLGDLSGRPPRETEALLRLTTAVH
ncbi:hypothetical protein I2W78_15840 [Streptomyces spinoverrucosus]|uniref:DUF6668 family protein n=1 Tax=Streptomyces spinoverrucosus TaxID=284043 RepID=UPI0018C3797B|nr:DUF6668 family protein [Streptomyces spinoverrucosus]MBG0853276.1 hypothetical protein [Streptomyces spinoverrucosus]